VAGKHWIGVQKMKNLIACGLFVSLFTVLGCGGVDVGGIPIDASGMTNNFDFGDINVGDINGLGDAVEDAVEDAMLDESATESAEGEEPATEPEEETQPLPHPADSDEDFLLTSEEVLSYAADFQSGNLPEEQGQDWVDVAVDIWLANYDGAYYDDMESEFPGNWHPLSNEDEAADTEETAAETANEAADSPETANEAADTDSEEETAADGGAENVRAAGYDLLFEASTLSVAPVRLGVMDPNGFVSTDWDGNSVGWTTGTAWDGAYAIQVTVQDNRNGISERISFSVQAYVDGEVVLDEVYSAAEGSVWSGPVINYP